jgi:hypothetical protein
MLLNTVVFNIKEKIMYYLLQTRGEFTESEFYKMSHSDKYYDFQDLVYSNITDCTGINGLDEKFLPIEKEVLKINFYNLWKSRVYSS